MSRILSFDFRTEISFGTPVSGHAFLLRCIPPEFAGQRVLECELTIEPRSGYTLQRDSFGNLLQSGRIEEAHSRFVYRSCGKAEISSWHDDAPSMACFRYPSAYTAVSAEMAELINNTALPENESERAEKLMHITHEHMSYVPGSTGVKTTAAQAFSAGKGVCQDYAHVFLALSRYAGLTVRYANGLREGLSASHAWCEVYIGGLWYGIDPTEAQWTDESYIRFGTGRDYADCPLERGVFSGITSQKQEIFVSCTAD